MSARDRFLLVDPEVEVEADAVDLDEDYDYDEDEDYDLDHHERGLDPHAWLGEVDED